MIDFVSLDQSAGCSIRYTTFREKSATGSAATPADERSGTGTAVADVRAVRRGRAGGEASGERAQRRVQSQRTELNSPECKILVMSCRLIEDSTVAERLL